MGRSEDMVDGGETITNSLGRAPSGRSETDAWTPWTDGKPWGIAWEELRWAEVRWKRR